MIAPTADRRKRAVGGAPEFARDRWPATPVGPKIHRHGIVSGNHNPAQLPPSDRPSGLRQTITALARSFQLRIPQPPAPRGSRDRACSQDSLSPPWTNESWSFFFWGMLSFRGAGGFSKRKPAPDLIRGGNRFASRKRVKSRIWRPVSILSKRKGLWREPEISFQYVLDSGPAPNSASPNDSANNEVMEVSEAWKLAKRRVGRSEHRARFVAIAILDIDHRGIGVLAGNIFQRHGPAAGTAVPVAYLEQITHHIVVSDFATAVLAAPD